MLVYENQSSRWRFSFIRLFLDLRQHIALSLTSFFFSLNKLTFSPKKRRLLYRVFKILNTFDTQS